MLLNLQIAVPVYIKIHDPPLLGINQGMWSYDPTSQFTGTPFGKTLYHIHEEQEIWEFPRGFTHFSLAETIHLSINTEIQNLH